MLFTTFFAWKKILHHFEIQKSFFHVGESVRNRVSFFWNIDWGNGQNNYPCICLNSVLAFQLIAFTYWPFFLSCSLPVVLNLFWRTNISIWFSLFPIKLIFTTSRFILLNISKGITLQLKVNHWKSCITTKFKNFWILACSLLWNSAIQLFR